VRATDSALRSLTDDEVEAGIAAVVDAHASAAGPIRSDGTLRLLVLRG
jgi:hypothetical protein